MSSDFEAYEQDFGTLTAEITNKIGKIPKLAGGKWLVNKLTYVTSKTFMSGRHKQLI